MVDGKIAQTLLSDDFDADFKDLELITKNNQIALQNLLESYIDNIDKLKAMVFDLFISSPKSSYFVTDCIVIY